MNSGRNLGSIWSAVATAAAALVIAGMVVFGWYAWVSAKQRTWALAEAVADRASQALRAEVGRVLHSAAQRLDAVAEITNSFDRLSAPDPEERDRLLRAVAILGKGYSVTAVIDANGNIVFDTVRNRPTSRIQTNREYFAFHRDDPTSSFHVSAPFRAGRVPGGGVGRPEPGARSEAPG